MFRLAFAALALSACVTSSDGPTAIAAQPEGAWDVAPTLHAGERVTGEALAHGQRVYPIWIAGTAAAPVPLDVVATAIGDDDSVRVAVLGPAHGGARAVLGSGGDAQPRGDVELSIELTDPGEYLIVVGAFDPASRTAFRVETHCDTCDPAATDLLAAPKDGALTGTGDRIVHATLGDAARDLDVTLELWASPPAHPAEAHRVATSHTLELAVPSTVAPGDDLRVRVVAPDGTPLDTGVVTRFAPDHTALVRTDALIFGDGYQVTASGVVGLFEGRAQLSMRSEVRHVEVTEATVTAERPGMVGNGLAAFDVTFTPEFAEATPPVDGELLSIGSLDGDGHYVRLGCFEYAGSARPCP